MTFYPDIQTRTAEAEGSTTGGTGASQCVFFTVRPGRSLSLPILNAAPVGDCLIKELCVRRTKLVPSVVKSVETSTIMSGGSSQPERIGEFVPEKFCDEGKGWLSISMFFFLCYYGRDELLYSCRQTRLLYT